MHTEATVDEEASPAPSGLDELQIIREQAQFRYGLRRFLRFSEDAARRSGVTPQQHQLMLGVAGFTEGNCATISELAEFLQEKNHSVVGLVERAVQSGLVRRVQDPHDRRVVVVSLTPHGEALLSRLTKLHREEIKRLPLVRPPGALRRSGTTMAAGRTLAKKPSGVRERRSDSSGT